MKFKTILAASAIALMAASCSTPKDVVYFQDVAQGTELATAAMTQITIQPKDELFINVSCADERLTEQFNLSRSIRNNVSSMNADAFLGYLVDSQGDIEFPVLGKLHIGGMTREQVAEYIKGELQKTDLVKDPVITVNFMNLGVIVLGEVAKPGRISINKDKLTVLDAIAQAGDLTIDGVRTRVLVIRDEEKQQKVYTLNLTDAASVYTSPAYYLQQEDVIYVEPNDKAIRSSTVNGNTLQTYNFWLTFASFLMSAGVLIFK